MTAKKPRNSGVMGMLGKELADLNMEVPERAPSPRLQPKENESPSRAKTPESDTRLAQIDPEQITPWAFADRPDNELGDMDDLMTSILKEGQQVPALVRQGSSRGQYELIFGRRRWMACKELGLPLFCMVKTLTDQDAFAAQAIENEKRRNLSGWARAWSYHRALDSGLYKSVTSLATATGLDRTTISNLMTFTRLPKRVIDAVGDWQAVGIQSAKVIHSLCQDKANIEKVIAIADKIRTGAYGPERIERSVAEPGVQGRTQTIAGKGGQLFSVTRSSRGALTLTILKDGKRLLDEDKIVDLLKAAFEERAG